jgi:hypothetical protein
VAQIEQVWRAVAEFSSPSLCEWVAWAIPIAHTSATASTDTALTNPPRLEETLNIYAMILSLDGRPQELGAGKMSLP